ncbi:MAG: hypothetical protein H6742_14675 [Alphaproteobacteria bacterium]|nr:hypothetical protein [Alphaproteobacteria bacterium]
MIRKLALTACGAVPLLIAGTGCAQTTAEMLEISLVNGTAVTVDMVCDAAGCAGDDVEAEVTFDAGLGVDDGAIVYVYEYRVDYAFANTSDTAPFFADLVEFEVPVEGTTAFTFDAAGTAQRDWVYGWAQNPTEAGTATLTIAGYDHNDDVFEASTEFSVSFQDTTTDASTDTGE